MHTTIRTSTRTAAPTETTGLLPFDQLSDAANHSAWRQFMAERIAMELDYEAYGVHRVYLTGSTERGRAGIGSDIDLIVYMEDNRRKRRALMDWLDAWSRALALTNYLRTGYLADGLLDVHIVTDRSIREHDSYAAQMNNPAACSCLTGGN